MRRAPIAALALSLVPAAYGNDGNASTSAGGIQLVREARISMEKERLFISEKKITVEYEFLNETDRDITTEVAFPIPPYEKYAGDDDRPQPVDNFHGWVEGRALAYQTEVKAILRSVDYSIRLRQLGIDIVSWGHFDLGAGSLDFGKLSKQQQKVLQQAGLFKENRPQWSGEMTHHWQQTFPARKILHVRHEYTPVLGNMITGLDDLTNPKPEARHLADFTQWCIDPPLRKTLTPSTQKQGYGKVTWVDYILTTANTWKTPIKQFELEVETPGAAKHAYLSFCWNGPILSPDPDHFIARATNFVPMRELSVAFFPGD
jgi:hypothetical protein